MNNNNLNNSTLYIIVLVKNGSVKP